MTLTLAILMYKYISGRSYLDQPREGHKSISVAFKSRVSLTFFAINFSILFNALMNILTGLWVPLVCPQLRDLGIIENCGLKSDTYLC